MTAPTARIASSADVARRLQPVVVGGDILAYSYVRELHRAYGIERTIVLATQDIKMLSSSRFTDYRLEPLIHDPEDLYDALERVAAQVRADDPDRVPRQSAPAHRRPRAAGARLRRLPCAHALIGKASPRGRRLHGPLHRLRPARRHHAEAPLLRAVRAA